MKTVLLLFASNIFMTFAWYYHLQKKGWPLGKAIVLSWSIALIEYCVALPANRIGYAAGYGGASETDSGGDYISLLQHFCSSSYERTFSDKAHD